MIKTIRICDKCSVTEENTNNFIPVHVIISKLCINRTLHLCPDCLEKLNLKKAGPRPPHEPTTEQKLYNLIYDIALEARG